MRQIAQFYRGSPNQIFHIRSLVILSTIFMVCVARRGPHHPNSEVNKQKQQQQQHHANEHLSYQKQHIQDDLSASNLPTEKSIDDMTEDERNYLYFKMHDLDGNDKLDGLEIYYSATHHSVSQNDHHHHDYNEHHTDPEQESNNGVQTKDAIDPSKFEFIEKDENGDIINKSFMHIIDVLDNFLEVADLNQDGYLNYPEYAAAVNFGNAMATAQVNEDL